MVLTNFLDKKVFFLQATIVLTYFQSEKSQHKHDLMQRFLLKRFTKLVKIDFRGRKAKHSHLSNFPFSFFPESVPKHYFISCQDFPHQRFKEKHRQLPRKHVIMNEFSVQI